jgi:hypothetical protein
MKYQQSAAYFATCVALTISVAAPSYAASITTAAGGGSGEIGPISDALVLQLLDDPVPILSNPELDGPPPDVDSDPNVPSTGASIGSEASFDNEGGEATATAEITFNDSVLNFKTFAQGTLRQALDSEESAFAAGVAILSDALTISSLETTDDGFYQLTFNLTGEGASGSGFGALAVSNNGELVYRNDNLVSAQSISTGLIPMDFGTQFDLDIGFASVVAADDTSLIGTFGTADFRETLTLSEIEVFDQNRELVNDVTFTSDSGISYRTEPVPAPSSAAGILTLGTLSAGSLLKRRYRKKVIG